MEYSKMNNRRRNYNSRYEKPAWEIEKERIEKERQEAIERGLKPTEENFPALGNSTAKKVTWSGRKFTELANEWKSEDDNRKEIAELRKRVETTYTVDKFALPSFHPSHHFVEEEGETEVLPAPVSNTETEWVTVDRIAKRNAERARREACKIERLRYMDEHPDEEPEPAEEEHIEEEESCWNGDVPPSGKAHDI